MLKTDQIEEYKVYKYENFNIKIFKVLSKYDV